MLFLTPVICRVVKDSSVVAVQIFDQRKFKRRDQGFLGVVNIRVSDVLDMEFDGHGMFLSPFNDSAFVTAVCRNVDP